MLKIGRRLEIDYAFFPVLALSFFSGRPWFAATLFSAALLHEGGHLFAAWILGARVRKIVIMPYGISLGLSKPPLPHEEGIIAAAGPLVSLLLLALAAPLGFSEFFRANLYLLIVNILPAPPLDGGRIMRFFLCGWFGYIRGCRLARRIGKVVGTALAAAGAVMSSWLLVIGLFLVFAREYHLPSADILLKSPPKKIRRIKGIAAPPDMPALKLIERFGLGRHYHLIHIIDNTRILYTLTEGQVSEGIISLGANATVMEIAKLIIERNGEMG